MPVYPGDPPVALSRMGSLETDGFLSHLASLPAHKALLGAGLVIIENLRNLGALPPPVGRGFLFLCLPVLGLDGSPVRAAALVTKGAPL